MDADTQAAIEHARQRLRAADLFIYDSSDELDEGESAEWLQTINLNDVFAWAAADGEYVPDEELPQLAQLYAAYGWCGVLYWVSQRRGGERSEFHDINRYIDFVRHEETWKADKTSSEAAYGTFTYTLGG